MTTENDQSLGVRTQTLAITLMPVSKGEWWAFSGNTCYRSLYPSVLLPDSVANRTYAFGYNGCLIVGMVIEIEDVISIEFKIGAEDAIDET
jgi:hypothetical protein